MDLNALEETPSWEWPANASEILLKVLRGKEAKEEERLIAAELAGNYVVINDELVDALLSILSDASAPEELRGMAAIALGPVLEQTGFEMYDEFEGQDSLEELDEQTITPQTFQRITDTLQRLYIDASVPKYVRRRILEASVRCSQKWHNDAIRTAYTSGDDDWRLTAVFGMAHVRGFDKEILDSLNDTNPDIHYEAVRAAGNWEIKKAWPHIASLLASRKTEKALLLAAIESSANISPGDALEALQPFLVSKDEDIAEAADEAASMAAIGLEAQWADEEDDED